MNVCMHVLLGIHEFDREGGGSGSGSDPLKDGMGWGKRKLMVDWKYNKAKRIA